MTIKASTLMPSTSIHIGVTHSVLDNQTHLFQVTLNGQKFGDDLLIDRLVLKRGGFTVQSYMAALEKSSERLIRHVVQKETLKTLARHAKPISKVAQAVQSA